MNQTGPIIVKRGFLNALVSGVFGTVVTVVICASGIGIYAMNVIDRKSDGLVSMSKEMLKNLPELIDSLPPVVAEACNDRRDTAYRSSLDITSKLVPGKGDMLRAVLEIANKGDRTVTMLALRVVMLDAEQTPISETTVYAATPLAVSNEWIGPLIPSDQPRKIAVYVPHAAEIQTVTVEVLDIRTWDEEKARAAHAEESKPPA